ncbi:hypothetical protein SEPCBS119000_002466 [Sporothrix epigloea]|uniref:MULE transposase domain-containing protein n=1 Tax=Sporothrix epigloea TaxID=1892477 RepID=A0ABP0DGD2_9PEZI
MDISPASAHAEAPAEAPAPLSIPPLDHPLRHKQFDSIDALLTEYREYAKLAGYGVHRTQASNLQVVDGQKVPGSYRRYTVACDLDAVRASRGSGIRKSGTKKNNCPFKLFAKCPRSTGKWVIDFESPQCVPKHEGHDVLPANLIGRGLHSKAKAMIDAHANDSTMRNRTLVELLREEYPDMQFGAQHVKNARARARRSHRDCSTHTQLMLKLLDEEEGAGYTVKWKNNDAEAGTMDGIYITHKFGDKMIKSHPYTVMFDTAHKSNKPGFAFFQAVAMTPFGVAVPVACGLINTELHTGLDWLLQQYKTHRAKLTDQPLLLAVTDSDAAMRSAVRCCFPNVQLQICKSHLNKQVALHISKYWKPRQAGRAEGDSRDQAGKRDGQQSRQGSGKTNPAATSKQEHLTVEENRRMRDLNQLIKSLETGGLLPVPCPDNAIEYSKAGIWALWAVILTRSNEAEFFEAWETMMSKFHDQTELLKYFKDCVWPIRREWARCHTRESLNFSHANTLPVENLKSYVVSTNTALDVLIRQYLRTIQLVEEKYEEQLRRNSTFSKRDFVRKSEFSQVKRTVTDRALNLANSQLLRLQCFNGGDQSVCLDSSLTENQGIISAQALFDRHAQEKPVLQVEDFHHFWWFTRIPSDGDKYLGIKDPEVVQSLRPRNNSIFDSDPDTSAQQMPSSWETDEVDDLDFVPSSSASTAPTSGRKRAASSATGAEQKRVASPSVASPDLIDLNGNFD